MNSGLIFPELSLISGNEQGALPQRCERQRIGFRRGLPCLDIAGIMKWVYLTFRTALNNQQCG